MEGASKTKFKKLERAQRVLLNVMYFKTFTYPIIEFYKCNNLSIRKLFVLFAALKV